MKHLEEQVGTFKENFNFLASAAPNDRERFEELDLEIERSKRAKGLIAQWDEATDLRFRLTTRVPMPATKAVMFCLMDVSASMTEEHKYRAKIFYILLHRFLKKHYDKVDVVFVRHTTTANEVDEKEFFEGKDTGGTVVSSCLEEMQNLVKKRYNVSEWNIYAASF